MNETDDNINNECPPVCPNNHRKDFLCKFIISVTKLALTNFPKL